MPILYIENHPQKYEKLDSYQSDTAEKNEKQVVLMSQMGEEPFLVVIQSSLINSNLLSLFLNFCFYSQHIVFKLSLFRYFISHI